MLEIHVEGTPAQQGSKRHVGHGRLVEMDRGLKPWRQQIVSAAHAAMRHHPGPWPLVKAVQLEVALLLPRGSTVTRPWPTSMRDGDIDKQVRAISDALTLAGVIADDSLIVSVIATQQYADTHQAWGDVEPGALIRVALLHNGSMRPCLDCGAPSSGTRCTACTRAYNRRRARAHPRRVSSDAQERRRAAITSWIATHGYVCPGYQRPAHPSVDLTADHVQAVAAGGSEYGQLAVLCRSCNARKGQSLQAKGAG